MKPKNCLIFGASGQIGRNLIRSLTKNNIKVTALTRNVHQKGYILKTQANPGYLEIVEGSIFNHELIEKLFSNADLCVNLIGILFEKGKNNFNNLKNKFSEGKQNFSKAKISEAWEKYKEEGGALSNKEKS